MTPFLFSTLFTAYASTDTDGDGLSDAYERDVSGTDPDVHDLTLLGISPEGCAAYVKGTELVTVGCNVHVRSGAGATDAPVNGKGNLIVGYNVDANGNADRSGSHNLVVGDEHSYASFGGLVAGWGNRVLGAWATVSGGFDNRAVGDFSSVSGGKTNKASGLRSAVSGGARNVASGDYASVSGGYYNTALGYISSASGGRDNFVWGTRGSISGGKNQVIHPFTESASISGGASNEIGDFTHLDPAMAETIDLSGESRETLVGGSITGGSDNRVLPGTHGPGDYGTASGGAQNDVDGAYATISGGWDSMARGPYSSISGGRAQYIAPSSDAASITGGAENDIMLGVEATISGGLNNQARSEHASISGGELNHVDVDGRAATIAGGARNEAAATYAVVAGGRLNSAEGTYAVASGGESNVASGTRSSVTGGQHNEASASHSTVGGGYAVTENDANQFDY